MASDSVQVSEKKKKKKGVCKSFYNGNRKTQLPHSTASLRVISILFMFKFLCNNTTFLKIQISGFNLQFHSHYRNMRILMALAINFSICAQSCLADA